MVYLSKLTIKNFKSFAGVHEIPIDNNFTLFVGPNGSGKSNIIDALCFVLGRSSAKSMRADQLDKLINQNPAIKDASVSIDLDNSDLLLPFDEKTIVIKRTINRNKESKYFLNGKKEQRQKILEILNIANIDPDGHNIVLQNDLLRIILLSDLEKRKIIEDLCGIATFDGKIEISRKKLDCVEQNLREVNIILRERQKIVENYEKERAKFEKHQKLMSELKKIDLTLAKIELIDIKKEQITKKKEIEERQKNLEKIDLTLKEKDIEADKIRQKIDNLNIQIKKKFSGKETSGNKAIEFKYKLENNEKEIQRKKERIDELKDIQATQTIQQVLPESSISKELKKIVEGYYGTVGELLRFDSQYTLPLKMVIGRQINNIVVERDLDAKKVIEWLKQNRMRATILPMSLIKPQPHHPNEKNLSMQAIGLCRDFVNCDPYFGKLVDFLYGSTLIVTDFDGGCKIGIGKIRMAALDGTLFSTSGAISGGFAETSKKAQNQPKQVNYDEEIKKLESNIISLEKENSQIFKQIETLQKTNQTQTKEDQQLFDQQAQLQFERDEILKQKDSTFSKKMEFHREINEKKFRVEEIENQIKHLLIDVNKDVKDVADVNKDVKDVADVNKDVKDVADVNKDNNLKEEDTSNIDINSLKLQRLQLNIELSQLGSINSVASQECEVYVAKYQEIIENKKQIEEEKKEVLNIISDISLRKKNIFMQAFNKVSKLFTKILNEISFFEGEIQLKNEQDPFLDGLSFVISKKGNIFGINAFSGGEKSLVAIALIFALQGYKPSPFYIFDEIDAALDMKVSDKLGEYLTKKANTKFDETNQEIEDIHHPQIIQISHNRNLVEYASKIYGVTMINKVSQIYELPNGK